jgi:hypothetical protein
MDTFMTPIEQHYWEQEKRLPSQSVVLIMRKLFILEEIFEQNPDIAIQNKYDLNFESIGNNLDYTFKNKNGDYIYDKNMDVAMEIKGVKYAFSHMDCRNVLFENQRLGKPSHFYESKDKSNAILLVSKYQNIYLQGNDSSNYCLLKRMY